MKFSKLNASPARRTLALFLVALGPAIVSPGAELMVGPVQSYELAAGDIEGTLMGLRSFHGASAGSNGAESFEIVAVRPQGDPLDPQFAMSGGEFRVGGEFVSFAGTTFGTGVGPRLAVTPPALSFGTVTLGATARRPLTLQNLGNSNLVITSIASSNSVFRVNNVPPLPLTLAPGQELALLIAYTPRSARQDFDRLRIVNNDPFWPELFVEMDGVGEPPDCDAAGPLPLHIAVNDHERSIWNDERNGDRVWNYEGRDFEFPVSDSDQDPYEILLNRALCTEHFTVYFTDHGTTHGATDLYVEQMTALLEDAWQALFVANEFRAPTDPQSEGRYQTFTDFSRIPVLIYTYPEDPTNTHASADPIIFLKPVMPENTSRPLHELFHLTHYGYTDHQTNWFREGVARWAQKFEPRAGPVCDLAPYRPLTHDFLMRAYCETAPWLEYLGQKYGRANAGSDGSDVIKRFFEELADVGRRDTYEAMLALERTLVHFTPLRASGVGNAFAEWAVGNYADDTHLPATLRSGAPLIPRYKEGGRAGSGGHQYLFGEYGFTLSRAGTVTIQVRASANDPDGAGPGDDDDLRVLLDGEVLADWNSTDSFDGETLLGGLRTVHLVKPDLAAGPHTLRLEGDEQPVLYSLTVFEGEVPWLVQSSAEARPETFQDRTAFLTEAFDTAAGVDLTVYVTGVAQSAAQNKAANDPEDGDNTRLEFDGTFITEWASNEDLYGDALEGDLATVELLLRNIAGGAHTLTAHVDGRPLIREIVVFPTPEQPPLLQVRTVRLVPWSAGYQVAPVTQALIDSGEALEFQFSAIQWDDDPPFSELLRVDASGAVVGLHPRQRDFDAVRGLSADCMRTLGAGGRLVHVTTATFSGGTYELTMTRAGQQPDRYDDPNRQGNPSNNTLADATLLPNVAGGDVFTGPGPGPDRIWEMIVPDLTLHDASDQDFFRLDLPDEAGDDCLEALPECAHGSRLGNGILEIMLHHSGGAEVVAYDALGNELGRDNQHLRVGCPRESGLDPFYFVVTNQGGCRTAYSLEMVYSVPDAGLWEKFGDRCIPCPPGNCGGGEDDSFRVITPPEEAWNDFIFGIDCNPIVCQPPKSDYLFFHWALEGPVEFEFEHAASAGFEFALLDGQFNPIGRASRATAFRAAGFAAGVPNPVTQRLSMTSLPAGYYALRVSGSQFGGKYSMRTAPPGLRIDPSSVAFTGGQVRSRWFAQSGRRYRVQFTDSLGAMPWADLGAEITATTTQVTFNDPVPLSAKRFYRILKLD